MEIKRYKELKLLEQRFKESPAVAILGPRQCGKTTLAHQFAKENNAEVHFFDLEDPRSLVRLENPLFALESLKGTIVIDEIQRRPDLFPVLRVLIDKNPKTKYLILGSASRDLLAQSSETLAGRISYVEMGGFSLDLLSEKDLKKRWLRGGFPRSFLAKSDAGSFQWRKDFVTTFLERDIPNLGIQIPAEMLRRFWMMVAHYHGQIFNASAIGNSLAINDTTARRYLDILSATFVLRQVQPWFYNTKKRLVKRPKVYFRDSGLFHTLISAMTEKDLVAHPKLGASWEGFALEEAIEHFNLSQEEVFFWAVHTGAECDLVFSKRGKTWGIEAKFNDAPTLTKSMQSAIEELSLEHLWVLYPGKDNYPLSDKATVVSLPNLKSL